MKSFVLWLIVFTTGGAYANEVRTQLEELVSKSSIDKKTIGVVVKDLKRGNILYEINGNKPRTPASLTKLITAYGVLKGIPRELKFVTRLLSPAKTNGKELHGDLYLVGGGDPSFVSESMWKLVNNFKRTGIIRVRGDIIVDDSLFDYIRYGRDSQGVDRAYDAPVSAMSFNWNSVNVYIRPSKIGLAPLVFADPKNEFIEVVNQAKTVSGRARKIVVRRIEVESKGSYKNRLLVTGQVGLQREELVIYKSVTRPSLWSGYNLKAFLEREGISVGGRVKRGGVSPEARQLASVESEPISTCVAKMMKFSNNYISGMLTKYLAVQNNKLGNMNEGLKILSGLLVDLGFTNFVIESSSGLSRRNKLRPMDVSRLLDISFTDFTLFPEFISSLPISGIDGTLKKRLQSKSAWVRAKTGLLAGVVGLAGYAGSKRGTPKSFVFIYNGKSHRATDAKSLFDRMALRLVDE